MSPNNQHCISVSSDKKMVLMDAKTGEIIKELENAHKGSIYSVAWFEDSSRFATCSADKTVKIWESPELKLVQ